MLLHALIPASRANGPGLRAVVFFQGCSLGCPKCWNPSTHQFRGTEASVDAVVQGVLRARQEHPLEGVTFSGGEPMQQADSLL
jgi:anaerobic ribonucleoside-triphosphate reductase activating protein